MNKEESVEQEQVAKSPTSFTVDETDKDEPEGEHLRRTPRHCHKTAAFSMN